MAQENDTFKVTSLENLQTMLTDLSSKTQLEADLNQLEIDIQNKLQEKPGEPTASKREETVEPEEKKSYTDLYKYVDSGTGTNVEFVYAIIGTGTRKTLFIALTEELGKKYDATVEWKSSSAKACSEASDGISLNMTVKKIGVVYMENNTVATATNTAGEETLVDAIYVGLEGAVKLMQNWRQIVEETLYPEGYKEWNNAYSDLLAQRNAKQIALNALKKYNGTQIMANIDASNVNLPLATWPAGYVIDGNYNTISCAEGATLFKSNEGEIENLVVTTGPIAKTNTGTTFNSIERTADGSYRVYAADGAVTSLSTPADAAYALRYVYGYDFNSKTLAKVTADNKVYLAQYASPTTKTLISAKVNLTTTNIVGAVAMPTTNAVVYIENSDAQTSLANVAVRNVDVTSDGYEYTCQNAVLTENSPLEFYIPFKFKANKLTYKRDFTQNYATVCLPFALTSEMTEALDIQYLHQFNTVSAEGFKFLQLSSINANEPCLIKFAEGADKTKLNAYEGELNFEVTPGNGVLTDGKGFYGIYKLQKVSDLMANNLHINNILYTIQDGKFVRLTNEMKDMPFAPFRGFVSIPATEVDAPEYKIILLDQDGNEMDMATDVKSVSADKDNFKVAGVNNAIEVSTDNACDVKVYTVNGTLVKSVRVEAGTTSLSMQAGIYIVNGVKVIVK